MEKKILIMSSLYPSFDRPNRGVFIREQAYTLALRYDVYLYVLARWLPEMFYSRIDRDAPYPVLRRLAYLFPPVGGFNPMGKLHPKWMRALAEGDFERIIKTWGKPDLIHAHLAYPSGYMAVSLGQKYKIPVVITEHTCPLSALLLYDWMTQAVRETLQKAQRVIAVSSALAQTIINFEPQTNITVIGNVIDEDVFYPAEQIARVDERTRFLAISSLEERKGLLYLLEAAKLLLERGVNDFELLIGGDGPQRMLLDQLVKRYKLKEHCRFLGKLKHPHEVRAFMQGCDVFVLPSLLETFGVVLAEAMACGKPVIATRCGGAEYVVTPQTGVLVNITDALSLADAMQLMMDQRQTYRAEEIRNNVLKRFGRAAFLQCIAQVYDEIEMSVC